MNDLNNNLLKLKSLVSSLNQLSFNNIKELYPHCKITLINDLPKIKNNKDYPIILLVLNSEEEKQGHYIVLNSVKDERKNIIFDPLGQFGLINMPNCNEETKNYLLSNSNQEVIQSLDSNCCGILCLLYIYINMISYCPTKTFLKMINNTREFEPNKNIINYLINLILLMIHFKD